MSYKLSNSTEIILIKAKTMFCWIDSGDFVLISGFSLPLFLEPMSRIWTNGLSPGVFGDGLVALENLVAHAWNL